MVMTDRFSKTNLYLIFLEIQYIFIKFIKIPRRENMRYLPFRASFLFLLLPLLTGCVGGALVYPTKFSIEHPTTIGDKAGYIYSFGHPLASSKAPIKCSEIIARWGEPDHKSVDGNEAIFVYKEEGFAWTGIMPFIVIPIPLIFPVESNSTTLICKDDAVTRVSQTVSGYSAAYCGMTGEAPHYGCKIEDFHF